MLNSFSIIRAIPSSEILGIYKSYLANKKERNDLFPHFSFLLRKLGKKDDDANLRRLVKAKHSKNVASVSLISSTSNSKKAKKTARKSSSLPAEVEKIISEHQIITEKPKRDEKEKKKSTDVSRKVSEESQEEIILPPRKTEPKPK
jgi:hypothetical protein